MTKSQRPWGTNESLGIASILYAVSDGCYQLDQDLKGRWHVWRRPVDEPESYDMLARQLEADPA